MKLRAVLLSVFLAATLFAAGAPPVVAPRGPEFYLMAGDTSHVTRVAMDQGGTFLGLFHNVFAGWVGARGGSADGLLPGFSVGPGARGANVAAVAAGEFVISWGQMQGYDTGYEYVVMRPFTTDGTPTGPERAVSEGPTHNIGAATAIGSRPDAFLVIWEEWSPTPPIESELRGRFMPLSGAPAPSFQVNTWTTGSQTTPRLATSPDGSLLAVWRSSSCSPDDPSSGCIRARHFDRSGQPSGADFRVNSVTTNAQNSPDVAWVGGGYAVVWASYDCDPRCVRGRLVDAIGAVRGEDFLVDEAGGAAADSPGVAGVPSGDFVVTWDRSLAGDSLAFARAFGAEGLPQTPEFQVNSDTSSEPYETAVAMNDTGNFVVVWSDAYNMWGRSFDFNLDLFADGFESGDTSGWDSEVGGRGVIERD